MDRTETRRYILDHATDLFEKDGSGKGYVCPLCNSGSGKKGTGLTTKDGIHFTCWAGCFSNVDIFDIIGQEYGINDYNGQLAKGAELMGIEYQKESKKERAKESTAGADYNFFFLEAKKNINLTDYHRGLSDATLARFSVGFMPAWKHPSNPNGIATPRLIIPTSKHSYLARDTRSADEITDAQKQYAKMKVGNVELFNAKALSNGATPIYVVEGEIDAMSIVDVGGEAVGLGSVSNYKKLLEMVKQNPPTQPIILCLDNDDAGQRTAQALADGLEQLHIPYYVRDLVGEYKDANEALVKNRAGLTEAVARCNNIAEEERELAVANLRSEAAAYSLQDFIKNIEQSKKASYVSTGFKGLDFILDGGLYAGLYVIGAISSLGKTTFTLQIADQIASQGHDVLIFSLEMARDELIAKSISRLTLINDIKENGTTTHAKTTRGILTGARYKDYSDADKAIIASAMRSYSAYAKNIYISEGIGNIGIDEIRQKVKTHTELMGKAPVILIDYLQILAPADARYTDKQNTDKAVLELKRISRDYQTPVLGISSFNRDNYSSPVNLTSYKESGAIEYSSDVLLGLQYEGMDYQEGEAEKNRDKRIRELFKENIENGRTGKAQKIQIKILKNRNGSKGEAFLDFYPMFNYFKDRDTKAGDTNGWTKAK